MTHYMYEYVFDIGESLEAGVMKAVSNGIMIAGLNGKYFSAFKYQNI